MGLYGERSKIMNLVEKVKMLHDIVTQRRTVNVKGSLWLGEPAFFEISQEEYNALSEDKQPFVKVTLEQGKEKITYDTYICGTATMRAKDKYYLRKDEDYALLDLIYKQMISFGTIFEETEEEQ